MEKTAQVASRDRLKIIFQTQHYKVVVGVVADLPDTANSLKVKYIVVHDEDGVIYGLAGGRGAAIAAALQAEKELELAQTLATEAEARGHSDDGPEFFNPLKS